jgi:hypothetical protein
MGDYLRLSDLAHLPDDLAAKYDNGTPLVSAGIPAGAAAS